MLLLERGLLDVTRLCRRWEHPCVLRGCFSVLRAPLDDAFSQRDTSADIGCFPEYHVKGASANVFPTEPEALLRAQCAIEKNNRNVAKQ